jgi:hypothetical protein
MVDPNPCSGTRGSFPSEEAAIKLLYLALRNLITKWESSQHWKQSLNRLQMLSRTRTRPHPAGRNAFSCSSAQTRVLERNTRRRTHFRLYPRVQHEQSRSPVAARVRIAHHETTVIGGGASGLAWH